MTFDRLTLPTYTIPEVAYFLNLNPEKLRAWVKGRNYSTKNGSRFSEPLIQLDDPTGMQMSFLNVVEAHVLSSIRCQEGIAMDRIRAAINFLKNKLESDRPFIQKEFLTDSKDLFIHEMGNVINCSRQGQHVIEQAMKNYLKRIEFDKSSGRPFRLYPMGEKQREDSRPVMVDPRIGFGRLVITDTGIPVNVLISRFNAGDSIQELSEDYNIEENTIETAIFWKTAA